MLLQKIDSLDFESLETIYKKFWNLEKEQHFSSSDYKKHLIAYIIQYYKFRSVSDAYRKKSLKIINTIKNI